MSMFENYLEKLGNDLADMELDDVLDAQEEHSKNPTKGFDRYLDGWSELDGMNDQQQESYLVAESEEFSQSEVDQVYEDRLNEFPQYRLKEELEQELPVKGVNKPLVKV